MRGGGRCAQTLIDVSGTHVGICILVCVHTCAYAHTSTSHTLTVIHLPVDHTPAPSQLLLSDALGAYWYTSILPNVSFE